MPCVWCGTLNTPACTFKSPRVYPHHAHMSYTCGMKRREEDKMKEKSREERMKEKRRQDEKRRKKRDRDEERYK